MQNLNVTLIQSDLLWQNRDDNLAHFDGIIKALDRPTDLVILPEMFTTGFTMEPGGVAEGMDGLAVRRLKEWAKITRSHTTGSIVIGEDNRYFNRLVWALPAGQLITYDKRHLFRMAGEEKIYTAGEKHITIDIHGWKIRPFICYDLRFPVWSRNRNLEYDVAVYVANWPESRSLHWKALLRARAIENQCFVIGVNRTGTDGNGISYCGDSMVIDFTGNILLDCASNACVESVELDYNALSQSRKAFPAWKDTDNYSFQ